MNTFQAASQSVVQSEIFNKIQLELTATPYFNLPSYWRFSGGSTTFNGSGGTGLSYFNSDGEELLAPGGVAPGGAVYIVRCTLQSATTNADQTGMSGTNVQGASGTGSVGPNSLAVVNVQIGFHIDPKTVTNPATDPRVATRSYTIAKRDTYNGA